MLRTVISLADLKPLLSEDPLNYVGQLFPDLNHDSTSCIVIEVTPGDGESGWKAGFYRIEKNPLHFEDTLRTLRKTARAKLMPTILARIRIACHK